MLEEKKLRAESATCYSTPQPGKSLPENQVSHHLPKEHGVCWGSPLWTWCLFSCCSSTLHFAFTCFLLQWLIFSTQCSTCPGCPWPVCHLDEWREPSGQCRGKGLFLSPTPFSLYLSTWEISPLSSYSLTVEHAQPCLMGNEQKMLILRNSPEASSKNRDVQTDWEKHESLAAAGSNPLKQGDQHWVWGVWVFVMLETGNHH